MTPVTYCPTCRRFALGARCRRHTGQRTFATLGAAVGWWRDWWEVYS